MSHVQRFGDLVFKDEPLNHFISDKDYVDRGQPTMFEKLMDTAKFLSDKNKDKNKPKYNQDYKRHISAIDSRDAKLHHLYSTAKAKKSHKAQLDLGSEINSRMRVDHVFEDFHPSLLRSAYQVLPRNFGCLKTLMGTYEQYCGPFDDYSYQYVKYIV